jgi:hypothetical protein
VFCLVADFLLLICCNLKLAISLISTSLSIK